MLFGVCMPCLAHTTAAKLSLHLMYVWHTLQANVVLVLSSRLFRGQPEFLLKCFSMPQQLDAAPSFSPGFCLVVADAVASCVSNAVCCRPTWMGDDCIVTAVVPTGVGPPPVKPPSAVGPKVQDNTSGKKAQARTYQDLLKDAYDEDTFEYYTNTELVAVQVCAASHCVHLSIYLSSHVV